MSKGTCTAAGCARPAHSRQLCTMHYQRERKGGSLPVVQRHRPHRSRAGSCEVDGCTRPVHAQGLCTTHDSTRRRNGSPTRSRRAEHSAKYHAHDGWKRCTRCDRRKPVGEFFANKATPDGHLSRCKACSKALERQDRESRPEVYRARRREHYVDNAERQRENTREWRKRNLERARTYSIIYSQKNRDRRREYDKTRREARAEQCRAWLTPERARNFTAKRRALKASVPQGDPRETLQYITVLDGDPCSYCGRPCEASDHIQPLSSGGAHAWWNLTAACTSCNSQKGSRELLDFLLVRLPD